MARIQTAVIGLIGLGRIGTATALRSKAFGWNVLFYDPYLPNGMDKALGIERAKDLTELFRRSTIVSLHCPSTQEIQSLIGYDLLKLLPLGAILVNTARGDIVVLDDLEKALREGILAGAGLDVLPEEPVPEPVHPLIKAYRDKEPWLIGSMYQRIIRSFTDRIHVPGLVLTCHTAFYSPSSNQEIRQKSAHTMRDVLIDKLQSNIIRG